MHRPRVVSKEVEDGRLRAPAALDAAVIWAR
jgi:hypothetical protein